MPTGPRDVPIRGRPRHAAGVAEKDPPRDHQRVHAGCVAAAGFPNGFRQRAAAVRWARRRRWRPRWRDDRLGIRRGLDQGAGGLFGPGAVRGGRRERHLLSGGIRCGCPTGAYPAAGLRMGGERPNSSPANTRCRNCAVGVGARTGVAGVNATTVTATRSAGWSADHRGRKLFAGPRQSVEQCRPDAPDRFSPSTARPAVEWHRRSRIVPQRRPRHHRRLDSHRGHGSSASAGWPLRRLACVRRWRALACHMNW
jgi:hypothetical protein